MNKLILLSLAFVCLWLSAGVQASLPETEENDIGDLDEGELAADEEFDGPDGEDEQNDEEAETDLASEVGRASGNRCGKKKKGCKKGYSCVRRCKSRCVSSSASEACAGQTSGDCPADQTCTNQGGVYSCIASAPPVDPTPVASAPMTTTTV